MSEQTERLIEELSSFDANARTRALDALNVLVRRGRVEVAPTRAEANTHLHTFFSFNACGWSPSRIVFEARRRGLEVAATVDFDVLDGAAETLRAGDLLGVKTASGFESRVFIREHSDQVMNSPNEPGIYYFVAEGFTEAPLAAPSAAVMDKLRRVAHERTLGVMQRVNAYLEKVQLDFDRDVAPLTPAGNATERHLLVAYDRAARDAFPRRADLVGFWTEKLGEPAEGVDAMLDDAAVFHALARARLMKFGAPGYAPPTADAFPTLDEVIAGVRAAGAIPSGSFLDGANPGEHDMETQLAFLRDKGIEALTVVPERNWRIQDPEEKARKLKAFTECMAIARRLDMPILAGTEMNKPGQPFVDAFESEELAPFVGDFLAGARFLYGHTLLSRACGYGALSDWSRATFGQDRRARNAFFAEVGQTAAPGADTLQKLRPLDAPTPEAIMEACGA